MNPNLVGLAEAVAKNVRNTDTENETVLIGNPQRVVVPDLVKKAQYGARILGTWGHVCQGSSPPTHSRW